MKHKLGSIATTITLLAVTVVGAAAPASANYDDSKSGTATCGGTFVPRLTSSTSGYTRHSWQSRTHGGQFYETFPSGGTNSTLGYQNASWTVAADKVNSASTTCVR